jgi:hypothetical protein
MNYYKKYKNQFNFGIIIICIIVFTGFAFEINFFLQMEVLIITSILNLVTIPFILNYDTGAGLTNLRNIEFRCIRKKYLIYNYLPSIMLIIPILKFHEYSNKGIVLLYIICFAVNLFAWIRIKVTKV